jgi:protein-tyrosine-phosphatase
LRYVLFICNHNAGRSHIAQALLERLAPADLRAESGALTRFGGAEVRTHIVTLALRQARDCLRKDHCDAIGVS